MRRIHDLVERCRDVSRYGRVDDDEDGDEVDISSYKHVLYSFLCASVLDSFNGCVQKLKFDEAKEGITYHKSLNPALYQAQEEMECLKYIFYTRIPLKYCHDWVTKYGEKLELTTFEEGEIYANNEGDGNNYWEWENILKRSRLFVLSFSAWWA